MIPTPTIRLVFTARDSFVSRAIRAFTKSEASHVGIVVPWEDGDVFLHATTGGTHGVQVQPLADWLRHSRLVADYAIVAPIHERIAHVADVNIGRPYDKAALAGFVAVLVGRKLGMRLKNPLATRRGVVCSEFVLSLDPKGVFIPAWQWLDPETTTPEDLLRICRHDRAFTRMSDVK